MNTIACTVLGTTAAILTSFGFVPQIMKMWQRKSVGDVSKETFLQFITGVSLWALYGVFQRDPVLIGANLVTLATLVIGLTLFYRFRIARPKAVIQKTVHIEGGNETDALAATGDISQGSIKRSAEVGGSLKETK